MNELPDTAEALEAKETAHRVPWGYWLLFWGLIVWGIWYAWTYTPSLGGWSQSQAYEQSVDAAAGASGGNIFATILFTVIPTTAAILLWVVASRRKPGKG